MYKNIMANDIPLEIFIGTTLFLISIIGVFYTTGELKFTNEIICGFIAGVGLMFFVVYSYKGQKTKGKDNSASFEQMPKKPFKI